MSKTEILAELPGLELADRREIFDRICEGSAVSDVAHQN
jgi:hypothetical protein